MKRLAWSWGLLVLTASTITSAQEGLDQCIDASDQGQVLRDLGKLLEARRAFITCAQASCPAEVRRDCVAWLTDVEAALPSVTLRVRDHDGRDLADVRVLVDGAVVTERYEGREIPLDPGEHAVRLERPGASSVQLQIVAREGEKRRALDVVWPRPKRVVEDSNKQSDNGSIPVGAWILGGVALTGGASLAFFGLRARGEVDDMRSSCAPHCDPSRVDDAKRDALIANVSLGISALALGGAVWLTLASDGNEGAARTGVGVGGGPSRAPSVVFSARF